MDVTTYLRNPERVGKFRPGTKVEATAAAREEFYGLEGEVLFTKNDSYPAMLVRWTAGAHTRLPEKWRGVPHTEKHRPEELKLVDDERWDDAGDYPEPLEEEVDPEPELDQLEFDDYPEYSEEFLTEEDYRRMEENA